MDLSIIIPTTKERNSIFNITLNCAVDAINDIDAEIIVVNDSQGYMPKSPAIDNKIRILNNPGKGVASARNYGAKNAAGKLLLFLDNDILISKASVKHIMTVHEQLPNVCINPDWVYPPKLVEVLSNTNFGRFLINHNMISYQGWHGNDGWQSNELFKSKSIASFHLSLSKSNFEKSGGYNTTFVFAGFEDYDFPLKLKSIGFPLYIDSRITVFHNEADKALNAATRLNALEMRANTRKIAVDLGFTELKLHYSAVKKFILNGLSIFRVPLIGFLNKLPNSITFYKLYVKIYGILEATYIYRGYMKKKNN